MPKTRPIKLCQVLYVSNNRCPLQSTQLIELPDVAFIQLVYWCVLWRNNIPPTAKVSEEVNRKLHRHTLVQLLALYTDPESQNRLNNVTVGQTDKHTDRRHHNAT